MLKIAQEMCCAIYYNFFLNPIVVENAGLAGDQRH